jgi:hypothetical protein
LTLTNDTFTKNSAGSGGVYSSVSANGGTGKLTITGSLFNANQATAAGGAGGGLSVQNTTTGSASASVSISNSTFYKNFSDSNGGGIALLLGNRGTGTNTAVLTSLTVYQNQAATAGGGLWVSATGVGTAPQVGNSIIAGNTINNPPASGPDVAGTVKSQGYNLVGAVDGSTGWNSADYQGTSANLLNPGLDPNGLADNGGPTLTVKMLTTSKYYRLGNPTLVGTQDQRGYTRKTYVSAGACDPDATP